MMICEDEMTEYFNSRQVVVVVLVYLMTSMRHVWTIKVVEWNLKKKREIQYPLSSR